MHDVTNLPVRRRPARATSNTRPRNRTNVEAHEATVRRLTVTVEQAAVMLGISRSAAYGCAARNEIPTIRLGRRLVVPTAWLVAMLEGEATRPAP
jgi:excisionase family DNA binding protein